ncbi:MAG TPA: hypothetical protein VE754_00620 [Actinomycetota bacterium]|nr:hypothetical protein [Actinomycetota bacterium]
MDPVREKTGRRRAFQVVTVVLGGALGALALLSLFAVVGLDEGERSDHRVHDLATVIQLGLLLGTGLIVQAHMPERKIALLHLVALTMVALGIAYAISGELPFALIGLVIVAVLIWLHPARERLLSRGRFSIPLGVLIVATAVPLAVYALDQAEIQRAGGLGIHWDEFHWASMAGLALGLPLGGIAAATSAAGWRIAAWLVGAAGMATGLGWLAFPDHPSSLGVSGGIAALAGGVLFVAVAEWEARRAARS